MGSGFFENKNGKKSITRLAFAFLILNAVLMSWFMLLSDNSKWEAATAVFGAVSSVATGLKLYNNHQENKTKEEKTK